MKRNMMVGLFVMAMLAGSGLAAAEASRPETRWRGFNLLGMFQSHGQDAQFEEEDFRLISELGFNFVRIPMEYRFWQKDKNWELIDEAKLTPEAFKTIEQHFPAALGYAEHQRHCGVHKNTGNLHMHVAYNMISI